MTDIIEKPKRKRNPDVLLTRCYNEETAFELRSATRFHSDPTWNKRDPQIPKSKWWLTEARGVGIRLVRPIKQPSETEANQFFKNYLGL